MSIHETRINNDQKLKLQDIVIDLSNNDWDVLYFATEKQINTLIDRGDIDEDFSSRHQEYQEELRIIAFEFRV